MFDILHTRSFQQHNCKYMPELLRGPFPALFIFFFLFRMVMLMAVRVGWSVPSRPTYSPVSLVYLPEMKTSEGSRFVSQNVMNDS